MIRKHRIYFFFWKIYVYFLGIKKGVFVQEYSEHKEKWINGVILTLDGGSVNQSDWYADVDIQWFEPHQGEDYRYHTCGSYSLKDFKRKIRFK